MSNKNTQLFDDAATSEWCVFDGLDGVSVVSLAEPVPGGSIHRARLRQGTVIPPHTHPADEYVLVVRGALETGGRRCDSGTFWTTPAHVRQGPHVAITDTELLTIRLGELGTFET